MRSIASRYEACLERVKHGREQLFNAQQIKNEAEELVAKFDLLNGWEFNFEGIVRAETQQTFSKYFESLDPDSILSRAPTEARELAAKLHAIAKKHEYTSNLQVYLDTEITDIEQGVQSISRVRKKWRRNPGGYVRGDKTKWLQSIPEMKREGTRKRLTWSQKMRGSLRNYDSYDNYGCYYYSSNRRSHGFLAYDVFNHQNSSRMPHEGFTRTVIPDVESFREEYTTNEWLSEAEIDTNDNQVDEELDFEDLTNDLDIDEGFADIAAIELVEMEDEIEVMESLLEEESDDTDVDDES